MKKYHKFSKHNTKKKQSGQTLVEFLLLLASIVVIAFSFMRLLNVNIADTWTQMAQAILEDDGQSLRPR